VELGATYVAKGKVNCENTAVAVGSGDVDVFATPMMIALMEHATQKLAEPKLKTNETSVGISVNITHTAATPIGMEVEAVATLTEINDRILTFSVVALDESGVIGEGIMKRTIVDRKRFIERADKKRIKQQ
jgi:predicted thioesterase